jgi:hypothetical protein
VSELLATHESVAVIEAEPAELASRVLAAAGFESLPDRSTGHLRVSVARDGIPALLQLLAERNVRVYSVNPRRSLEEYFLTITAEAERGPSSNDPGKGAGT